MCIRDRRRPDGYVGKPPELGTGVFSMNSGANSGAPLFDSTHVVDYQFVRNINSTWNWETGARIIGSKQVYLNTSGAETNIDPSGWKYDYMNGWHTNASGISNYQCWMWKRHAGFDVVTYEGNQVSREVKHNLNAVPEMIWSKDRTESGDWIVYHKGLNSGTNPAEKFLYLNKNDAENGWVVPWNDTEPTSVWYPVQASTTFNKTGNNYVTMLFASVDGISKVGYYDGSNSAQTITTGFQPRFVIIKKSSGTDSWIVLDTTRGWASGNDNYLQINSSTAQISSDYGIPTSTGFTVAAGVGNINDGGHKYIYYAHA